ncbi:hypothetical protein SAMD00079811_78960 (plasmid) [Scytonema sp. HK-05]|nr:hypothetical protein [Scytonema sp. HK-05]BAY50267.1 hypothetical protein SAMD00079811_78960 [Scytonema sp. HK-05]
MTSKTQTLVTNLVDNLPTVEQENPSLSTVMKAAASCPGRLWC